MSTVQLRRLAIGLGVVVAIWLGLSLLRRSGTDRRTGFRAITFDRASVTTVVIGQPGDTLTLARVAGGWTVNGLPAATDLVERLLADLTDSAATGEIVAESPSSHARLGVDSAGARRVTVHAGERLLAQYLVGNRGVTYGTVYLRQENDPRVYQVKSGLTEAVSRSPDDWRDKRILTLATDSIGAVDLRRGGSRYAVERSDSSWRVGGSPADTSAVDRWLSQLGSLTASGFASTGAADSADFTRPDRTLRIRDRAGREVAALVFDSIAGGFLVRRDGSATVFRIDSWTADRMVPSDSTLRARSN